MPDTVTPNENVERDVQATPNTMTHYLPADVVQRTLALASKGERASGAPAVKLRMSGLPSMNGEPVSLLTLPNEVLAQIAQKLDRNGANALALTCQLGYRCADSAHLMRHLPGLLGDLKRMGVGTMEILPASLSAFLQAISAGGDYDRVLLTSLSQAERCAASIAVAAWAEPRLHRMGQAALLAANRTFFENNYDEGFTNGLEAVLDLQLGVTKPIRRSEIEFWKKIFDDPKISQQTKKITFGKLLCQTQGNIKSFSALMDIAGEYTADADVSAMAIFAVTNGKVGRLSSADLAKMRPAARNKTMRLIIDAARSRTSSDKLNPDLYALALIAIVRGITKASKIDPETFSRMVAGLGHLLETYYFSGFYKLTGELVRHCPDGSPALAFDDLLFSDSGKKGANVGLFARLFIDKIAELRADLPAEKLLQEILCVIHFHNKACPRSEAYIGEKIAMRN